jgi:hypothetical protein
MGLAVAGVQQFGIFGALSTGRAKPFIAGNAAFSMVLGSPLFLAGQ